MGGNNALTETVTVGNKGGGDDMEAEPAPRKETGRQKEMAQNKAKKYSHSLVEDI